MMASDGSTSISTCADGILMYALRSDQLSHLYHRTASLSKEDVADVEVEGVIQTYKKPGMSPLIAHVSIVIC